MGNGLSAIDTGTLSGVRLMSVAFSFLRNREIRDRGTEKGDKVLGTRWITVMIILTP
ncbi:hypothetical protein [Xylanivirga thermophila]|uniref:hypothetical protein n=1 Tax=Xylanivirga thermophila TaxID=2496273 RepID=UPI0013EC8D11|nr:hypothetical protein [Xylanivirga thermophila]